jgi:hypothetical protein
VLTKVHGKPTYESLQTLQTQVKANASSVPSTLGGGLYGHLGSILSPAIYATLPNSVPWITPTHPGPFALPAAGTAAQIEAAREVWRALTQSYAIYQATAQALVAQIVDAVDPIYLEALRNRHTGQYSSDTRHVLQHLFATYAKITPQPYASAAYQHQGNHRLMEGHPAWTEEMADKNESEICTRREEHAPIGVLDQQ